MTNECTTEEQRQLTEFLGECWHEMFKHDGEHGTSTKYAYCPKCEARILTTDYYPPHAEPVRLDFSDPRVVWGLIEKLREEILKHLDERTCGVLPSELITCTKEIQGVLFHSNPQLAICNAVLVYLKEGEK